MNKKYESLYRRYRDQPPGEIFALFAVDKNAGHSWEDPFEYLANMAKPEEWNFIRAEYQKPGIRFPILGNFLNNTFLRLQQLNRLRFTPDGRFACFNTGLQTPDEKDIFATFSRNWKSDQNSNVCDWIFAGFFDSYSKQVTRFRPLPDLATFIEDATDLVLDIHYDIDVNIGHILDDPANQERLPEVLRGNRNLAMAAIEGATKFIKQKVLRNYKTAIPFWYIPESKIQLLLPLCLIQPDKADMALVADKHRAGKLYRIRTALRMDMAYNNARLITRPDREWLNP